MNSEKFRQVADNLRDIITQPLQKCDNNFSVANGGLVELYCKHEARIYIRFALRIGSRQGETREFLAVYERLECPAWNGPERDLAGCRDDDGADGCLRSNDKNQAVFIDVVETLQNPEQVGSGRGVSSVVWLQRLDNRPGGHIDTREAGAHYPQVRFVENRKLNVFFLENTTAFQDELVSSVVKSGSKAVDNIPDDESAIERRWDGVIGDESYPLPFRLVLCQSGAKIFGRLRPGLQIDKKLIEVMICPRNSRVDVI